MPAETEWLVGRKDIAKHLGISEKTLDVWRGKYSDLPVVVIHGEIRATRDKLDLWIMDHAENRCPRDGSLCAKRVSAISCGREKHSTKL